jgi:hypothetical protein
MLQGLQQRFIVLLLQGLAWETVATYFPGAQDGRKILNIIAFTKSIQENRLYLN